MGRISGASATCMTIPSTGISWSRRGCRSISASTGCRGYEVPIAPSRADRLRRADRGAAGLERRDAARADPAVCGMRKLVPAAVDQRDPADGGGAWVRMGLVARAVARPDRAVHDKGVRAVRRRARVLHAAAGARQPDPARVRAVGFAVLLLV